MARNGASGALGDSISKVRAARARSASQRDANVRARTDRESVLRRRSKSPRLGRGDHHAIVIAILRRDQPHVIDRARVTHHQLEDAELL